MRPAMPPRPPFGENLIGLRDHPFLARPVRFYAVHREQLLYLVVGGWNVLFSYGVWAMMQYFLGDRLPYLIVLALAWPIAVLNAYLGYRYIVFRSRGSVSIELPRFVLVSLLTLMLNLVLLPIALALMPFTIYLIEALLTGLVIICSYLGHKYFTFREGYHKPPR